MFAAAREANKYPLGFAEPSVGKEQLGNTESDAKLACRV